MASLLVDSTGTGEAVGGGAQHHVEEGSSERPDLSQAPGEEQEAGGGDTTGRVKTMAVNGRSGGGAGDGDEEEEEEDEEEEEEDEDMVRRLAQISLASRGGAVGAGSSGAPSAGGSISVPGGSGGGEALATDMNRMLISQMLSLANPNITEGMLQFLLQRGNLEIWISFITQVAGDDEPHPSPSGPISARPGLRPHRGEAMDKETEAALAKSFKATLLLASDEPSEALMAFLGSKATVIIESIFEVFHPHARGSFHHACKVIDYLLRSYTDQVLMVVGSSKSSVKRYLGSMIRCLEHPPVSETLVKLICLPSMNQLGQYKATHAIKWRTFESLAEWRILVVLAEEVFSKSSTPEHASAAADVLIDLIERLAADENGELVLQPLGHLPELVNGLLHCALDPTAPMTQRCECARVLVSTAARSAELELPGIPGLTMAMCGPGAMTLVPNQLRSVRNDFFKRLGSHLQSICDCLLGEGPLPPPPASQPVAHPGYVVPVPFSFLRLLLVTLLVEIVSADHKRLGKLQLPVWRLLCNWFFQYPFSNLYHGLFYKLVYLALRSGDEAIQLTVLSKCRLISQMVDAFQKGEPSAGNRGYILQYCNAVRLQAGTQAPSTWLRTFLKSHDSWRKFVPQLREVTEGQQQFGLGIVVPSHQKRFGGAGVDLAGLNPLSMGLMEAPGSPTAAQVSIDYGSSYARSLGFGEEEVEYIVDEDVAQSGHKKKKKKKKKGGKGAGGGGGAAKAEEGDEDGEDDTESETSGGSAANS